MDWDFAWRSEMNGFSSVFSRAFVVLGLMVSSCFAQQKLAQTGFEFLSVSRDARAAAMGEAFLTLEGSSTALEYNPAGIARMSSLVDLSLNHMKWIADISYYSGTLALNIKEGRYGVLGVSILRVDYGEFLWTRVASNEKGYEDITGWAQPSAYMIGLGYAKELSDRFSVGGQVKYAYQDLGTSFVPIYTETDTTMGEKKYALGVVAFDFGTLYRTGLKSLKFGMAISNFSREVKYEKEGFQLPLTFKMGASMNLIDFFPGLQPKHTLVFSIDAVHPRSYPEFLNIGAEYTFMETVALRVGYVTGHEEYGFTAGVGVRKFGFEVDYSLTPFLRFENVNRLSVKFSL